MKIIHVARFELRRLLLSPLAWIVCGLVQFMLALLFYLLLSQYLQQPELYAGRGLTEIVVGGFFQSAGLILLLITPFLTMRLISEDLRSGTIRLLLSSPVSISEMVLGKYLAVIVYVLCLVFFVSLMPASLMLGTSLDIAQFISGIFGLVLLMCASVAIGLYISSLFRHPAAAAASTFAVILLFWTIHVAGTAGNVTGNSIFIYLSIPHHFNPLTAGVINTGDLVFFLLLIFTGIVFSIRRLDGLRSYHWQIGTTPMSDHAKTGYRINSVLMLCLFIALAIVLAWFSNRFSTELDWTQSKRHTLSDTSVGVLEQIHGPVQITAYAREQSALRDAIREFIEKYRRFKDDITLKFINPDTVPDEVRRLGINVNGELLLDYQGRTAHVRRADETTFTNALIRLSKQTETWIAFLEGHGERNLLGKANHDLGEWGRHLRNRGYSIQPLNLVDSTTVPDNTSLLILAGPQVSLLAGEIQALLQYLQRGGNLLWLLDPGDENLLRPIGNYLGIAISDGTVADEAGQLLGIHDPTIAVVTKSLYGGHPALTGFDYTTIFPKATTLQFADNDLWTSLPLLSTGNHTWLERGTADAVPEYEEGADDPGPFIIGLTLERKIQDDSSGGEAARQRIAVIGDGDFLSNAFLDNSGNLDLGMRIVHWLNNDETFITIPVRHATDSQLIMPPALLGGIGIFFLFVLPLLIATSGLLIWWRRSRY